MRLIEKGRSFRDIAGRINTIIGIDGDFIQFSVICNEPFLKTIEMEHFMEMLQQRLMEKDLQQFKVDRDTIMFHLAAFQFLYIPTHMYPLPERKDYSLTEKDYRNFRGYAVPLIKKVLKCNRLKAEKAFDDFYDKFGIKIKNK